MTKTSVIIKGITCPKCKELNPFSSEITPKDADIPKFCMFCGERLILFCPTCGTDFRKGETR